MINKRERKMKTSYKKQSLISKKLVPVFVALALVITTVGVINFGSVKDAKADVTTATVTFSDSAYDAYLALVPETVGFSSFTLDFTNGSLTLPDDVYLRQNFATYASAHSEYDSVLIGWVGASGNNTYFWPGGCTVPASALTANGGHLGEPIVMQGDMAYLYSLQPVFIKPASYMSGCSPSSLSVYLDLDNEYEYSEMSYSYSGNRELSLSSMAVTFNQASTYTTAFQSNYSHDNGYTAAEIAAGIPVTAVAQDAADGFYRNNLYKCTCNYTIDSGTWDSGYGTLPAYDLMADENHLYATINSFEYNPDGLIFGTEAGSVSSGISLTQSFTPGSETYNLVLSGAGSDFFAFNGASEQCPWNDSMHFCYKSQESFVTYANVREFDSQDNIYAKSTSSTAATVDYAMTKDSDVDSSYVYVGNTVVQCNNDHMPVGDYKLYHVGKNAPLSTSTEIEEYAVQSVTLPGDLTAKYTLVNGNNTTSKEAGVASVNFTDGVLYDFDNPTAAYDSFVLNDITLPTEEPESDEASKEFVGWEYNGKTYAAGAKISGVTATYANLSSQSSQLNGSGNAAEITAKYETKKFKVTFKDHNGKTLDTQTVKYGEDATAPESPTREGYKFTGWDKSYKNITKDTTVTAEYKIKSYTVRFIDWDETVLDEQTVEYGKNATAPADPTREGYTFVGWSTDFNKVKKNLEVTALYEAVAAPDALRTSTVRVITDGSIGTITHTFTQSAPTDETFAFDLPTEIPTKSGSYFNGYRSSYNGRKYAAAANVVGRYAWGDYDYNALWVSILGRGSNRLNANVEYRFGSGSFHISGDTTEYAGDQSFFVDKSGDYVIE